MSYHPSKIFPSKKRYSLLKKGYSPLWQTRRTWRCSPPAAWRARQAESLYSENNCYCFLYILFYHTLQTIVVYWLCFFLILWRKTSFFKVFFIIWGKTIYGLWLSFYSWRTFSSCFFFYRPGPEPSNGYWNPQKLIFFWLFFWLKIVYFRCL